MKTQIHSKILAVAAAAMIAMATSGSAALARGGGGFGGGHMGGEFHGGPYLVARFQRRRSSIPPVDTLCRRRPRHRSHPQVPDQYFTDGDLP